MLYLKKLVIILLVSLVSCSKLKYHDNTELAEYLKNFTAYNTKGIRTTLYSIGKSIKGNDLWVVNITAVKQQKVGIPNIKFIGTIHGNEPVGREILLYFMEYLRDNYETNSEIRWLLDNTRIHILPNLNPDGFALANEQNCNGEYGRSNGKQGMDLNRNFPDYYHKRRIPEAAETKAVKKWMTDVPFILSAGLHGGALVANYPFDTIKELTSYSKQPPSLTPDDDVFKHLANVYAQNHLTMHQGKSCTGENIEFEGGITNGAAWYPFSGGMQDYNYAMRGCMELTLEISCCKYPDAKNLAKFWEQNKK
ncbi:carboxypeptidase D-like, partial [Asbolus verrucosus]